MKRGLRILVHATDAFGARGGISQYNRHLLQCLCADPRVDSVVALPRTLEEHVGELPAKLEFVVASAGGIGAYLRETARRLARRDAFDLVICAHLHLLPVAAMAAARFGAPLALVVYGVEAWVPPAARLNGWLLRKVDAVVSISRTTRDRMLGWYPGAPPPMHVLPNAFDPGAFSPGPKPAALAARYGVEGRRVLLLFGRMSPLERRKGFDEVLEAMPTLVERVPDLCVLFAGDGGDRPRLEAKARALGIVSRVVFTGFVPEADKPGLYRLADACILPSRQEGFGFVLLEAMACGIPAIGSIADGSREAVLDGRIGLLVDPTSREDIVRAVTEAFSRPREVPAGLEEFSLAGFQARLSQTLTQLVRPEF